MDAGYTLNSALKSIFFDSLANLLARRAYSQRCVDDASAVSPSRSPIGPGEVQGQRTGRSWADRRRDQARGRERRRFGGDFGEVQVHRLGVAGGQDERGSLAI